MNQQEIHYKLNWQPQNGMPGAHRSCARGDGFEFDTHLPLGAGVDPRRFDLVASSRDPLERLLVKRYRQTSAVDVTVIADMSASMLVKRTIKKLDVLAQITDCVARSVYQQGDNFAFYGCADTVLPEFICSRTRDSHSGIEIAAGLRHYNSVTPVTSQALLEASGLLPARRGLVFLVSDFFIPARLLAELLDQLSAHMVVPLLLVDSVECKLPPSFGLMTIDDVETGQRVRLFMRPSLRKRYQDAFTSHRDNLRHICQSRGHPLLEVIDRFDADDVSKYFMER